jgi:hypothetical protein
MAQNSSLQSWNNESKGFSAASEVVPQTMDRKGRALAPEGSFFS